MKNKFLIALILVTVVLTSCKKDDDFTNPDNLAGTEWKSLDTNYGEYELLKFNSKTKAEYMIQEFESNGGKLVTMGEGTYSIAGNRIYINAEYDEFSGTIDGKTMNLDHFGENKSFIKQ